MWFVEKRPAGSDDEWERVAEFKYKDHAELWLTWWFYDLYDCRVVGRGSRHETFYIEPRDEEPKRIEARIVSEGGRVCRQVTWPW
ncbi:MAG: hypothetical protein H5U02_00400 [Clostridia bacterium]|nr:hypothetical protein [Clostridia bacterium]